MSQNYFPPEPTPQVVVVQNRTNTNAILALVFAFVFAPVGLILGIISLNQIKRTGEEGKGLAISGIVIGGVTVALGIFMMIMMVFGLGMMGLGIAAMSTSMKDSSVTQSDMRSLATDMEIYYTDNGAYPANGNMDLTSGVLAKGEHLLVCYNEAMTSYEIWGETPKGQMLRMTSDGDSTITFVSGNWNSVSCGQYPSAPTMSVWGPTFP